MSLLGSCCSLQKCFSSRSAPGRLLEEVVWLKTELAAMMKKLVLRLWATTGAHSDLTLILVSCIHSYILTYICTLYVHTDIIRADKGWSICKLCCVLSVHWDAFQRLMIYKINLSLLSKIKRRLMEFEIRDCCLHSAAHLKGKVYSSCLAHHPLIYL